MLLLTRHEVESLLKMDAAIAAVEQGFRRLAAGEVVMPQRAATEIVPHNGLHLSMPAFVAGDQTQSAFVAGDPTQPGFVAGEETGNSGALTIKIVTVYGDNPTEHGLPTIQGLLLLHDARTGTPLALMDAEALTAIRTGAAGGVAAKQMARPDAQVVTLFGAGAQAAAQIEAVCAVRAIHQVYVITRTGHQEADFCARLSERLGISALPARALDPHHPIQAAVEAAHIICTATNSPTPLFDGRWLQPGTHINAIGTYKRTMRELDGESVRRSRIIVDQHAAAQAEAGDILLAIQDGIITYAHVAGELGEVVTGALPGRTHDQEITLFKSVGLAMQDAVTAAHVYAQARAQGIGTEVSLV